jgi:hypothetical protein
MEAHGRRDSRRIATLLAVAGLLVVVGLLSAISAPAGPPRSNKADAYGGPTPTAPTNPKSAGECNKYYGTFNPPAADRRECLALAKRNAGNKRCAKKRGAAKTACKKAVRRNYAKEHAAVLRQQKAENACSKKNFEELNALNPDDPDYEQKSQALNDEYQACRKKATTA